MILDAIRAAVHDKATMYVGGFGILTWATLDLWLKHAGAFAGNLVPIVSLIMLCVTIYVKLYPRQPTPPLEKKEAAKAGWSAGKKFGVFIGALMAVAAVLMFWKSDAKAATPQAFVSAPAGKKRKADDDTGGDTSASVPDPDEMSLPPWFLKAKALIGVAEALPNGRANPQVKAMFAAVDGFDPATVDCRNVPWCSVFVNYVLQLCGVAGTRNAMARSFMRSRAFQKLDEPRIGCIVVMWRGRSDDGETGHVGLYGGEKGDRKIVVLGGNQNDQVEYEDQWKSKVLGYYWPRGKWESKQFRGKAVALTGATGATGALAYDAIAPDDSKIPGIPDGVSLDAAKDTLEPIREALEATGHPRAVRIAELIGIGLLLLTIGGTLYALWHHSKDHDAGRL